MFQLACSLVMGGSREGTGGPDPPPMKNHKNIGFLTNTGPVPLKTHKMLGHVGPSSARQRNAIAMAFRWRTDDGPFISVLYLDPLSSYQLKMIIIIKKRSQICAPLLKNRSRSAHASLRYIVRLSLYSIMQLKSRCILSLQLRMSCLSVICNLLFQRCVR